MRRSVKTTTALAVTLALLLSLWCFGGGIWVFAASKTGIVTIDSGTLNVREGAGTSYKVIGSLNKNDEVTVLDSVENGTWYRVQKGTLTGYVSAEFITIPYSPDADFESYLTAQGFPDSYKPGLRTLHAKYPNWVFTAKHLGLDWSTAVGEESVVGRNLVLNGSARNSWKSMEQGAYNWEKKEYVVFDSGGWVSAQRETIAYYMDPRNFLDDTAIFQFETLSYSASHTAAGVNNIIGDTFMKNMTDIFMEVAKENGVSVLLLASRALQEQGKDGNALGRGYVLDGKTYYNFFDIGAYAANGKSAIENGAIYAKGRGWDTPKKSIAGGAQQLAAGYIKMGQDTLYLQKFDVVDGGNGYYRHQYMTNVTAAKAESSSVKKAYSAEALKGAMVFSIPVYKNMPASACAAPQSSGNNDNTLTAITVNGYSLTPTFSRYTTSYSLTVAPDVTAVTVSATKSDSGASVGGTGTVQLKGTETTVPLTVKAPSGLTRTYTVSVYRPGADGTPYFGDAKYTIGSTYITGIAPGTTAATLLSGLPAGNGTVRLVNGQGAAVTDKVATGQTVQLMSGDKVYASYPVVIYGDVNGDGAVSLVDLLMLQKHILDISPLSGIQLTAADNSKDGKVSIADLLRTQKQILGISSPVI